MDNQTHNDANLNVKYLRNGVYHDKLSSNFINEKNRNEFSDSYKKKYLSFSIV